MARERMTQLLDYGHYEGRKGHIYIQFGVIIMPHHHGPVMIHAGRLMSSDKSDNVESV